jgi:hypothetical protein
MKKLGRMVLSAVMVFSVLAVSAVAFPLNVNAYQGTGGKDVYVQGKKAAYLEARVWMSTARGWVLGNKSTFDVTTSTWVLNPTKPIRDHSHTQYLEVKGIGVACSLSVSKTVGVSLSATSNTASFTPAAVNGSYRGYNSYNNVATSTLTVARTIHAYSKMSVLLDGQGFSNQGYCWQLDRI